MKPPEQVKHEFVRQWLAKAEEDFRLIQHLSNTAAGLYLSAIGFHAQQAAEKLLKAFLVDKQIEFPKTHDIDELLDLVGANDAPLANRLRNAAALTAYGVELRYPSESPKMTMENARRALQLVTEVREAILAALDLHA